MSTVKLWHRVVLPKVSSKSCPVFVMWIWICVLCDQIFWQYQTVFMYDDTILIRWFNTEEHCQFSLFDEMKLRFLLSLKEIAYITNVTQANINTLFHSCNSENDYKDYGWYKRGVYMHKHCTENTQRNVKRNVMHLIIVNVINHCLFCACMPFIFCPCTRSCIFMTFYIQCVVIC